MKPGGLELMIALYLLEYLFLAVGIWWMGFAQVLLLFTNNVLP
jgi:hypothetical protein